ncbi:MAG: CoA ester lyase [Chloroflexota bacterium]
MLPLRSILFTPGDSERKLNKASQSAADAVVIDLEDAVAPSMLDEARTLTVNALKSADFRSTVRLVRINADSFEAAKADIKAILPGKPDGIVIPKIESADTLQEIEALLPESISIFALIETPLSFLNLPEIASSPRLTGLMLGGEDLIAAIGARPSLSRKELNYARGALVMAAAAYNLQAIDTVYTAWRDVKGLKEEAQVAADIGFTGKLAIHPAQLPPIHEAFAPTVEEVEWATDIIAEGERLKDQGIGVFSYGGRMIDEAHIRRAEKIMELNTRGQQNG